MQLLEEAATFRRKLEGSFASVAASSSYLAPRDFDLLHTTALAMLRGDSKQKYKKCYDSERKRKARRRKYFP